MWGGYISWPEGAPLTETCLEELAKEAAECLYKLVKNGTALIRRNDTVGWKIQVFADGEVEAE